MATRRTAQLYQRRKKQPRRFSSFGRGEKKKEKSPRNSFQHKIRVMRKKKKKKKKKKMGLDDYLG